MNKILCCIVLLVACIGMPKFLFGQIDDETFWKFNFDELENDSNGWNLKIKLPEDELPKQLHCLNPLQVSVGPTGISCNPPPSTSLIIFAMKDGKRIKHSGYEIKIKELFHDDGDRSSRVAEALHSAVFRIGVGVYEEGRPTYFSGTAHIVGHFYGFFVKFSGWLSQRSGFATFSV